MIPRKSIFEVCPICDGNKQADHVACENCREILAPATLGQIKIAYGEDYKGKRYNGLIRQARKVRAAADRSRERKEREGLAS